MLTTVTDEEEEIRFAAAPRSGDPWAAERALVGQAIAGRAGAEQATGALGADVLQRVRAAVEAVGAEWMVGWLTDMGPATSNLAGLIRTHMSRRLPDALAAEQRQRKRAAARPDRPPLDIGAYEDAYTAWQDRVAADWEELSPADQERIDATVVAGRFQPARQMPITLLERAEVLTGQPPPPSPADLVEATCGRTVDADLLSRAEALMSHHRAA